MKHKNDSNEEFIDRTNALAMELGVPISAISEIIEVSPATFFAYRAGRRKVSNKSWKKLELVENEKSITHEKRYDSSRESDSIYNRANNVPVNDILDAAKRDIESTIEYVKESLIKHIHDTEFSNMMIIVLRRLVDVLDKIKNIDES